MSLADELRLVREGYDFLTSEEKDRYAGWYRGGGVGAGVTEHAQAINKKLQIKSTLVQFKPDTMPARYCD